jgi:hypothetical protein
MHRILAMAVVAAVGLVGLGAPAANAVSEKYQSRSLNAFWHIRKTVDADTYLRTTWYAGAYQSGEGDFWSDLYKETQRCQVRDGRDRCREVSFAYGAIRDLGDGSFTVDRKVTTGHLKATYRLHTYRDGERVNLGPAHIVADLTGRGDVWRSRESYSSHSKCDHYRFSGTWRFRRALATGTLDFRGVEGRDLGTTRDAGMAAGETIEVSHSC